MTTADSQPEDTEGLEDGEYLVGPEEPRAHPEVPAVEEATIPPLQTLEDQQYTLRGILLLMVIAAAMFGASRFLSPPVVAGIMGLLVLLSLLVLSLCRITSAWVHMLWWGFLAVYLLVSGWAVATG